MRNVIKLLASAALFLSSPLAAQQWVDIGTGVKSSMEMGSGQHAIILVHGRGGNAQSWFKSDYGNFGRMAAESGFRVLSVGWAGIPGQAADAEIGMATSYLSKFGSKRISLIGFSAGGGAIAIHARGKPDGTFHALAQLSSVDDKPLALDKTLKVFAYNIRDQWSGVWQQRASRESSLPKEIIELPGAGHFIPDLLQEKPDLLQLILDKLKQ